MFKIAIETVIELAKKKEQKGELQATHLKADCHCVKGYSIFILWQVLFAKQQND